jgi:hypothetical protein
MKTRLILLILLPFLLNCQHTPVRTPKTRQDQEDDIREAVFRYLLENAPPQPKQHEKMYYLAFSGESFQGKDPDSIFMRRFSRDTLQLKKVSQCTTAVALNEVTWAEDIPPFTDKITGKEGIVLAVGAPSWINDDIVTVDGSYQESIFKGSYHIFFLEKKNTRWIVIRVKETTHHGLDPIYQQKTVKAPKKWRLEEDDIREAVFRYQFEHNGSLQQKRAGAYYLAIRDTSKKNEDPDIRFMERFVGNNPPVKKASQWKLASATFVLSEGDTFKTVGVVDRQTGKTGLCFTAGEIDWLRDVVVVVDGGYYESVSAGTSGLYYVIKGNNQWVVKGERVITVS